MKKIILIIFISLMFCNIGFSEIRILEHEELYGNEYIDVNKICVDGKVFVHTTLTKRDGKSSGLVQVFEERDGKSLPAKC